MRAVAVFYHRDDFLFNEAKKCPSIAMTSLLLSTKVTSLEDMKAPTCPEQLWNDLVEKHRRSLGRRGHLTQGLEYESFVSLLETSGRAYRDSRVARCVQTIMPSLEHLNTFSMAISNMAQGQSNPCSFLWGALQMVFDCARQFGSTLASITHMLQDLINNIAVFNRYIGLLPKNVTLQKYLRFLYDDYISFCVDTIKFYRQWPCYLLISMLWSTRVESFESSQASIQRHIRNFENETRVTVDELTVQGIDELRARLPQQIPSDDDHLIWEVPFSQNGLFYGRDEELQELHRKLISLNPDLPDRLRACVIHSMGGMGKTQLALEYAYRFRAHYDCILWLAAEQGPELAQNLAEFAGLLAARKALDPKLLVSMGQSKVIQEAMRWLERTKKKWLIIYDNAEDWESITPYWPHTTHGSIILTSQRAQLSYITGGSEIRLQPMDPIEGAGLLLKLLHRMFTNEVPILEMVQARVISQSLGGLPIAITHCAGWIDKSQSTLSEFSAMYERREGSRYIWAKDHSNSTYQYDKRLDTLWDIALRELSTDALSVINVMSMLSPERIPEGMLLETFEGCSTPVSDIIINLRDRQLVRRDALPSGVSFSIHRSLQRNLLHKLDEDPIRRQELFERVLRILRRAFPRQSAIQAPVNDNWTANDNCLPHVLSLQDFFEQSNPPIKGSMLFVELLSDAGNHLWERGLYPQGAKTLEVAEAICESSCSTALADVIEKTKLYVNLGGIALDRGITGRAKGLDYFSKILALRRRYIELRADATVEEVLLLANAWNDIACVLNECQNYDQAGPYLEMSLEIKRSRHIPEEGIAFFNYAENYKNLAWVYIAKGDKEGAVKLARKAVQMMQDGTDKDSAATEAFEFHLAVILFNAGLINESLKIHEAVKERRIDIFGPKGAHTLHSYYACAVIYNLLDRKYEAVKLMEMCLNASEEIKWPRECVARTRFQLGNILIGVKGDIDDAERLLRMARELRDKLDTGQILMKGETWIFHVDSFEAAIFDHLVSYEAGRYTIGDLKPVPIILEHDTQAGK